MTDHEIIQAMITYFERCVANAQPETKAGKIFSRYIKTLKRLRDQIVYCKDCDAWMPWGDGNYCSRLDGFYSRTNPDDYCSKGHRKEVKHHD